jgi:hypothetical protein
MQSGQMMIHVRFAPDGTVTEISERPGWASPQAWFNALTDKAGTAYQPLSGGRGVFRVNREDVDTWKVAKAPNGAVAS